MRRSESCVLTTPSWAEMATVKQGKQGTEDLRGLRLARVAISGAFAAQGFGYAVVVTSLPAVKDHFGLDATTLSIIVLLMCITAAGGSLAAGQIARRRSSKLALVLGLFLQVVSLSVVAVSGDFGVSLSAWAVYGAGLGAVDASSATQGVLLQNRLKRTIMSSFFAAYTGAAIVASLIVAAASASGLPSGGFLLSYLVAVCVILVAAVSGTKLFYVENLPGHDESAIRDAAELAAGGMGPNDAALLIGADGALDHHTGKGSGIPVRRAIWLFGLGILFVFVADSAVSTWSTEYLQHTLLADSAVAPLAYAAYQAVILLTRLSGDAVVRRFGRRPVVYVGTSVGIVGFAIVVVAPSIALAIVGFALVGIASGVLVPMTFSAAGEVDPAQNDRIISSLNTFNYVGAVLGGAAIGALAETGIGMAAAFLLPAVLLVPFFLLARFYGARAGTPR